MRPALRPTATFMLLLLLGAGGTAAGDSGATPAMTLEQVLDRFSAAQASTQTLQAAFHERKDLALFKEPVVQSGTFYHTKPQFYLWDYQKPTPKKVLLNDEILLAYYPDLNKAEEVNIRRWTQRIRRYLDVGSDLEALRADYDIVLGDDDAEMKGAAHLILTPRTRKVQSRLQELRIWIDRETGQTRRVSYLEPGGDRTVFTFSDIRVNPEIAASRYDIRLPKGVKMGDTFTAFSGR